MTEMLIWVLIGVDVGLFATSFILFSSLQSERKRHREQSERTNRIALMLEEMVRLNESAFRNMTHTIRSIETEVQRTDREPTAAPTEKRQRVLGMLRKGLDVDEITQRLNLPRGEVELVAQISNWAGATPAPATPN